MRKSKVTFKRTGSFEEGSALKIPRIVGGIPADLLKIVLKFSYWILSSAYVRRDIGNSYKVFEVD